MDGGEAPRDCSQAIADAKELGLPPEMIAALEDRSEHDAKFEVWPENWPALTAFLSVSTQWRIAFRFDGTAYWQGLDYAGAERGLALAGHEVDPALWADIRLMEVAARNRLNGQMETD